MRPPVGVAAIAALLAFPLVNADGLYSKGSSVLSIDQKGFNKLKNSYLPSIVEFYAPWCGHCKNLKPAFEKAAKSLEGLAQVAAVNCDDEGNKAFCGSMNVKGFPTLKTIKPTGSKGKPIITDYQGERSTKAMIDAVKGMIPNHVTKVTDKELDKWLANKNSSAKAILFSNKGTTSALIKALAVEHLGKMQIAQIGVKDTAAVSTFGITTYPTLLVLPGGTAPPVAYDGPMEKKPMSAFLLQYAFSSTESDAPDPTSADSKASKQKPIKDKAASSSDSSTFSEASAAHKASEASKGTASPTVVTIDLDDFEATPSPDPNVVGPDTDTPISLPVAPPLPTLLSQSELRTQCLGPKTPTCVLALLPPAPEGEAQTPESATEALASLAEISEKHKVRGSHLFPFFAVPASNEAATTLRSALNVGDGVQIVAVNGRREWYRTFVADKGHGLVEVEGWIDGIRLGEGKKEKLPAGMVVEEVTEEATSKARRNVEAATESVKSGASRASGAASAATEAVKDKVSQATDAAVDAADAASSATYTVVEKAASASGAASSAASATSEKVADTISSVTDEASSAASTASSKVADTASSATDKASSAASAVSESVASAASSATIKASSAASSAADAVSSATDTVKGKAASASEAASAAASSAATAASEKVADKADYASDKASSATSAASETVEAATEISKETAASVKDTVVGKAENVKEKIAEAVESAAAKVSAKASSVAHREL